MAVGLSQVWTGTQFFDNKGNPLNGGHIWQYRAGSDSEQQTTYSDSAGHVENSNPIILDSSGRIPVEIWLTTTSKYKLVLTDNQDNPLAQVDELSLPTGGGGGGGVSFPLLRSDQNDFENTDIAWVNDLSNYPTQGDSRLRGTNGGDFRDSADYQRDEVWYDPGNGVGEQWNTMWEVYTIDNFCCCDGATTVGVVHIPNLQVDTLTGISAVTELSTGPGLTASSSTGIVEIYKTNGVSISFGQGAISTQEKIISLNQQGGYYVNWASDGFVPQTFKYTVNGLCTATANGATTVFRVRMGYNNSISDQVIAQFNVVGAIGTNIPFTATFNVSFTSFTSQITTAQIWNTGTTGVATLPFTGSPLANGNFNTQYGGLMNLSVATSGSNLSITPLQVIVEEII
jgi:hypothetical protein